jgi:hypothetical protein
MASIQPQQNLCMFYAASDVALVMMLEKQYFCFHGTEAGIVKL